MKIAVSAKGSTPDSEVDPRFGRAPWFVVLDTETGEYASIDNSESVEAASGAGVQAVSRVAKAGVTRLVTGQCGPKSAGGLEVAGVEVITGASGTARDALESNK